MNNEERNTQTYERAWSAPVGAISIPDQVWYSLRSIIPKGPILEIGAGVKPSIPISGNHFLDISTAGVNKVVKKGGIGKVASVLKTGYKTGYFKAVYALEILEHVEQDVHAMLEIKRVLADDGLFIMSTPVFMDKWTKWDEMATHVRRYQPLELQKKLRAAGFRIIKYKTRTSIAKTWSVPFPIWFNGKYPNTAMFIAQYFAFYPARAIGRFNKARWRNESELRIPTSAAGVTIVAKKI